MAEAKEKTAEERSEDNLEGLVGLSVVVLATFLGVANVKDGNIVQAMDREKAAENNSWAWFQARNIRGEVLNAVGHHLSVPFPNETPDVTKAREKMSSELLRKGQDQEVKMKKQEADAIQAKENYFSLNAKDDQFDLCEAALAIGLAMMGVTALIKRWWLFYIALIPSLFGLSMGIAGFLGFDTNTPAISWFVELLS